MGCGGRGERDTQKREMETKKKLGFHMSVLSGRACGSVCMGEPDDNDDDDAEGWIRIRFASVAGSLFSAPGVKQVLRLKEVALSS